jgi:hypothetical protein
VFDPFHGEGGAEDRVLEKRLRFIALIKSSRVPTEDGSGEDGVEDLGGEDLKQPAFLA